MTMNKNEDTKIQVEANEKHLLLDHNYDGIQELNHPLPNWWNVIFYISIFFGIAYFSYYQFMGGPSLKEEFTKEHSKVLVIQEEYKKQNSAFNVETYTAHNTVHGIKKGEEVFVNNCLPCHGENGIGDIGPNLTDKYWLVAKSTPETIYNVVFSGSEENGMPPWAEVLTSEEIYQAVAYVSSLKNTNKKGGKAPEGERVED